MVRIIEEDPAGVLQKVWWNWFSFEVAYCNTHHLLPPPCQYPIIMQNFKRPYESWSIKLHFLERGVAVFFPASINEIYMKHNLVVFIELAYGTGSTRLYQLWHQGTFEPSSISKSADWLCCTVNLSHSAQFGVFLAPFCLYSFYFYSLTNMAYIKNLSLVLVDVPLSSTEYKMPWTHQNGLNVPSVLLFCQLYTLVMEITFVNFMQQMANVSLFWKCVCKSYIFTCRLLLLCVFNTLYQFLFKKSVWLKRSHLNEVVRNMNLNLMFILGNIKNKSDHYHTVTPDIPLHLLTRVCWKSVNMLSISTWNVSICK